MGPIVTAAILAGMAWFEAPQLIKKKEWKELGVFALVWAIAATLAMLLALQVPLPVTASYQIMLSHKLLSLFGWSGE